MRQVPGCRSGPRATARSGDVALPDVGMGCEHKVGTDGTPHPGPDPTVSVSVELRAHLQDGRPEPEYQIRLCFGEEYPGPPDQPEERLIMAHVSHLPRQQRTTHSSPFQMASHCSPQSQLHP